MILALQITAVALFLVLVFGLVGAVQTIGAALRSIAVTYAMGTARNMAEFDNQMIAAMNGTLEENTEQFVYDYEQGTTPDE